MSEAAREKEQLISNLTNVQKENKALTDSLEKQSKESGEEIDRLNKQLEAATNKKRGIEEDSKSEPPTKRRKKNGKNKV